MSRTFLGGTLLTDAGDSHALHGLDGVLASGTPAEGSAAHPLPRRQVRNLRRHRKGGHFDVNERGFVRTHAVCMVVSGVCGVSLSLCALASRGGERNPFLFFLAAQDSATGAFFAALPGVRHGADARSCCLQYCLTVWAVVPK